jgi:hypothetical protein
LACKLTWQEIGKAKKMGEQISFFLKMSASEYVSIL